MCLYFSCRADWSASNGFIAWAWGRNNSHTKRFSSCPAVGGTVTCCCVDAFVNFVSKGCVVSIVFCLRNNWMAEFIVPSLAVAAVAAVTMAWTNQSIPNISDALTFLFPKEIWDPLLQWLWPGFSFVWIMAWILGITYAIVVYGEKTYPYPGAWSPLNILIIIFVLFGIFLVIAWYISPVKIFGVEVMNTTPNTCTGQKTSLEAGLCYNNCDPGYHGSMTSCYADSVNVGSGVIPGYVHPGAQPPSYQRQVPSLCPPDWSDDGLLCRNPIRCDPIDTSHFPWTGGGCHGGQVEAKQPKCPGSSDFGEDYAGAYWKYVAAEDKKQKGTATEADLAFIGSGKHTSEVAGLCYNECPPEYPERVKGMPYLCYKGGALSYDRGVGDPPRLFRLFGKYAFPPFG